MRSSARVISVDAEGNVESVETAAAHAVRERLRRLAWFLDSSIPVPGTRFTVGIDALIGLFPVIGDLIGAALSSFILAEAARLGAARPVLLRMALNIGLEGVVGIVPFAGDLFDAAFKANQRNVRLLEHWLERPRKAERSSRLFAAALIGGIAIGLALLVAAGVLMARWLLSLL
jgi:hypothetical protein